jgi:hypothetical protein
VPVTVTVYVPVAVALPTLRVSAELLPELMGFGLNPAVVPAGRPVALTVTLCAEPLVMVVAMVDAALPPWGALTLLGLALMEKSDGVAPQPGNLKVPTRVFQLKEPVLGMYSLVYQKVQPSTGSTVIAL